MNLNIDENIDSRLRKLSRKDAIPRNIWVELSRLLAKFNSQYKGILRTYLKFVVGAGVEITFRKRKYQNFWNEYSMEPVFDNGNFWFFCLKWLWILLRDGETFIYLPKLEFIDVLSIKDTGDGKSTNGIYLKDGKVTHYGVETGDNVIRKIDEKLILHVCIDFDDDKRGDIPFISIMETCDDLMEFILSRRDLNEIRSSVAILKKTKTPVSNKTFDDVQNENPMNQYQRPVKKFQRGTVIETNGIEYEFLEPKLGAGDANTDCRLLRLLTSALTGLPEYMITGDSSNSNFASTLVSQSVGEKEIELYQGILYSSIELLIKNIILREFWDDKPVFSIDFPAIIPKNLKEETERCKILYTEGVISLQEWRRREEVDSHKMDIELGQETYDDAKDHSNDKEKEPEYPEKPFDSNNNKTDDKGENVPPDDESDIKKIGQTT